MRFTSKIIYQSPGCFRVSLFTLLNLLLVISRFTFTHFNINFISSSLVKFPVILRPTFNKLFFMIITTVHILLNRGIKPWKRKRSCSFMCKGSMAIQYFVKIRFPFLPSNIRVSSGSILVLLSSLHGVRFGILSKQKNRKREIPGRYLRMATAQILLPEKLDSKKLEVWERWIERSTSD